jgi:hypothetical protein
MQENGSVQTRKQRRKTVCFGRRNEMEMNSDVEVGNRMVAHAAV